MGGGVPLYNLLVFAVPKGLAYKPIWSEIGQGFQEAHPHQNFLRVFLPRVGPDLAFLSLLRHSEKLLRGE